MTMTTKEYTDHFESYGCKFYKITSDATHPLCPSDRSWLLESGLPDNPIPIFFFDFHMHILRDVDIADCKMLIGTAFNPTSNHYIYVNYADKVMLQTESGDSMLINSSLNALTQFIFMYSNWLEKQEESFEYNSNYEITDDEIFNLYCALRSIDKAAMYKDGIWTLLLKSKINFEDVTDDSFADYE